MKYITFAYRPDNTELLGSNSCFGDYANDRNAIRYLSNYAVNKLNDTLHGKIAEIRLYRYTNFYDDSTFKLVHTWHNTKVKSL